MAGPSASWDTVQSLLPSLAYLQRRGMYMGAHANGRASGR
jgi:hypothetical protein